MPATAIIHRFVLTFGPNITCNTVVELKMWWKLRGFYCKCRRLALQENKPPQSVWMSGRRGRPTGQTIVTSQHRWHFDHKGRQYECKGTQCHHLLAVVQLLTYTLPCQLHLFCVYKKEWMKQWWTLTTMGPGQCPRILIQHICMPGSAWSALYTILFSLYHSHVGLSRNFLS